LNRRETALPGEGYNRAGNIGSVFLAARKPAGRGPVLSGNQPSIHMKDRYFKFIAAIIVLGMVLAFFSSTSAQTRPTSESVKPAVARGL
jgi:hypothetical protein